VNKRLARAGEVLRYRIFHTIDRFIGIPLIFLCFPFGMFARHKTAGYNRILIIKLSLMGDTILLVPALRAIRERFPQAKISVILSRINAEILKDCPYIDEKIIVPLEKLLNLFYFWGLIRRIRRENFDLAIDFEQWFRISALISFLSQAKERLGFKTPRQHRHYLFTKTATHRKDTHELESFLDLARVLNIETTNKNLELWPQEENLREAKNYLVGLGVNSDFMILHTEVSATGRQRQWPIEKFAELGKRIREKYNLRILIASTFKGMREAEELNALLGEGAGLLIGIRLLTLFVIASQAKLVVTNNTGFMHLAASAGVAVIGLHGPTSPLKWGPWGKKTKAIKSSSPCSPCLYLGFEYGCKTNKCMQEIQVDEVYRQAQEFLGANIA
jgi:lipopolysaccharide heptosyltransferase II